MVPGHPRSADRHGVRHVDPRRPTPRRDVGHLPRRALGPVDHHRGLRGAAPGRRRPPVTTHGPGGTVGAVPRRDRRQPGLHPHLDGHPRPVGLGRPAGPSSRDPVSPLVGPPQHLRLRLLGPPDGCGPHRGDGPPAGTATPLRHRRAPGRRSAGAGGGPPALPPRASRRGHGVRAHRSGAAPLRTAPVMGAAPTAAAQDRPCPGRAVDPLAPRGGRPVGGHSASGGLLDHRTAALGLPARPPGHAGRVGGARRLRDPRRKGPPDRSLPVTGVGHGPGRGRALRRRRTTG